MRRLLLLGVLLLCGAAFWLLWKSPSPPRIWRPIPFHPRLARPYGMAPAAFDAFVRACSQSKIHPFRLGQTIGDHPRSVGYHKRDGTVKYKGQNLDYTAAVDIGALDLTSAQRARFLEALAQNGFAAWWRSGPNWRNGEHIHAVYALLPMKNQLRGQVRLFLRERRRDNKSKLSWEKKLPRSF